MLSGYSPRAGGRDPLAEAAESNFETGSCGCRTPTSQRSPQRRSLGSHQLGEVDVTCRRIHTPGPWAYWSCVRMDVRPARAGCWSRARDLRRTGPCRRSASRSDVALIERRWPVQPLATELGSSRDDAVGRVHGSQARPLASGQTGARQSDYQAPAEEPGRGSWLGR